MNYIPDFSVLIPFIGACWLLQTSPGPDMVLVVGKGISFGKREALYTVLGIFLAMFIQAPAVAFGATIFVTESVLAYTLIKGLGATYLIYLAYTNIRTFFQVSEGRKINKLHTRGTSIRDGFVTNLTNPKVLLFMLAFVPQFTTPEKGSIALQLLVLIFILKINGLVVNGLVGIAAGAVRTWLSEDTWITKWQSLLIALVFVSIAVWFIADIANV